VMSSATPSVEIIPGHRDHRSGDRNKLITITPESVITIVRNADHDHTGTAITIVRNQRSRSSGIPNWEESFVELPDAIQFLQIPSERVFQQPQGLSLPISI
jgi:hypothetical protein